ICRIIFIRIMKKLIYQICSALFISVAFLSCNSGRNIHEIKSPDHSNVLTFSLTEKGEPQYTLTHNHKTVIAPSLLGFEFEDTEKMTSGFEIVAIEKDSVNEVWEQPWGEFKKIVDNHNQLTVHLRATGRKERSVDIVFRVFNDGLGFRYVFPEQAG